MSTFYYFAYGSNMSKRRLTNRIQEAQMIGVASLEGYQIICNKMSKKDHSAKFNIWNTNKLSDTVIGVLYEIDTTQLEALNKFEGATVPYGYECIDVKVIYNGHTKVAKTYICTSHKSLCDPSNQKPYSWYIYHAVTGAREAGISDEYINKYLSLSADEDKDISRKTSELNLYN